MTTRKRPDGTSPMYIDLPDDIKLKLDEIALKRSKPGARVSIKTVVVEALEQFIQQEIKP